MRALALPTLLVLLTSGLVTYGPALWLMAFSDHPSSDADRARSLPISFENGRITMVNLSGGNGTSLGFSLLLSLLLDIPANVVLLRIQVALLPDNNMRTVVPVDRTFGMPAGLFAAERDGGGRGWLSASWWSVVTAFRSVSGQWVDYYILLLKNFGIIVGIEIVAATLLVLQVGILGLQIPQPPHL
jgi:hypothetical protein